MRQLNINITVLLLFVFCFGSQSIRASSEAWVFSTIGGQLLKIQYEKENRLYALTIGDVTEKVSSCETNKPYAICFLSNTLDLVIPLQYPEAGESWTIAGTTFTLQHVANDLKLLGYLYNDVLVINVERDLSYYLPGIQKIKQSKLYYSYSVGLIAYRELSEGIGLPAFISVDTPSLGRKNI